MGMLRPARKIGRPFFGARAAVPKGPYKSVAAHVSIASSVHVPSAAMMFAIPSPHSPRQLCQNSRTVGLPVCGFDQHRGVTTRHAAHKFLKRSEEHRTRRRPPHSVATDPKETISEQWSCVASPPTTHGTVSNDFPVGSKYRKSGGRWHFFVASRNPRHLCSNPHRRSARGDCSPNIG